MKAQRFLKSNNSEYVSLIKCGARHTQFRDRFFLVIKCQLALFVCIFQTDDCLILDISFKFVKSKASPFVLQSNDALFKTCTERNIFKMTILCFSLWEKSKAKTTHFRNHLSSRTKKGSAPGFTLKKCNTIRCSILGRRMTLPKTLCLSASSKCFANSVLKVSLSP